MLKIDKKHWKICEGVVVGSRGSLRGICSLWDCSFFNMEISHKSRHWILTSPIHQSIGNKFHIFNVYIPINYKEKEECWHSL